LAVNEDQHVSSGYAWGGDDELWDPLQQGLALGGGFLTGALLY
jgi:hypothetical protein